MRSLSTRFPLLRRQRAHRQRVDFLAHALASARKPADGAARGPSRELAGHDQRLEMLPVADHFHVLAGEPAAIPPSRFQASPFQYLSLYPP